MEEFSICSSSAPPRHSNGHILAFCGRGRMVVEVWMFKNQSETTPTDAYHAPLCPGHAPWLGWTLGELILLITSLKYPLLFGQFSHNAPWRGDGSGLWP